MAQYYYLVATLPFLRLESPPPISVEDFTTRVSEWVGESDQAVLRRTSLDPDTSAAGLPGVAGIWARFETSLRNALVALRAQGNAERISRNQRPVIDGPETFSAPDIAREAMQQSDPLQLQLNLDRNRWMAVDSWETGHHFDLDRLVTYSLKLQLGHRMQRVSGSGGLAVLQDRLIPALFAGLPEESEEQESRE